MRNTTLYYATGNSDKFETVARFIEKNFPHIVLKPCVQDFVEIQSYDQKSVALDKARQAWNFLQEPVLVDDSGVYFEKYNKFPGVLTKYIYQGIGLEGLLKLVEPGDCATFRLHLVYWYGPEQYEIFEGFCAGKITNQKEFIGTLQFPYDTLFIPDGTDKTYAELRQLNEHDAYDYRIQALKSFLYWYTVQK
jgi:non-canonical purine NTP pyrophosphatase (RdgB/HAM1 family)